MHNRHIEINRELDTVNTWLKVNKLSLNVEKTKCMLFHKRRQLNPIQFSINGRDIDVVSHFQARQTRQNSGGLQMCSQDLTKGDCKKILFLRVKNIHFFKFLRKAVKKGQLLRILHNKKVHFLEFLCKSVKKANF